VCRTRRTRLFAFAVAAAGVLLASPEAAFAHDLGLDDDPNRPLWKYLWFGFLHMASGWDHLLFILGVVLIAGSLGTAAKLISLFVAGHSLTLLIATLAGWQLDPTLVDVVIALSVVYVGVRGIAGGPPTCESMARSSSPSGSSTVSACPRACKTSGCPTTAWRCG
jgi:hydrogenase/urease accessory protein HupE